MNFKHPIRAYLGFFLPEPKPGAEQLAPIESDLDWRKLVTPGHVIMRRVNSLSYVPGRLNVMAIAGIAAAVGLVLAATAIVGASKVVSAGEQVRQRVSLSFPDSISPVGDELTLEDFEEVKNLSGYVDKQIASLQSSHRLAYPCTKSEKLFKPWGVSQPLCRLLPGESSDAPARVYLAGWVREGKGIKPWFTMLAKIDGEWTLIEFKENVISVPGVKSPRKRLDTLLVSPLLKKDWPELASAAMNRRFDEE